MGKYCKGTRFYIENESIRIKVEEAEERVKQELLELDKRFEEYYSLFADDIYNFEKHTMLVADAAAATGISQAALYNLTEEELAELARPKTKKRYHFQSMLGVREIKSLLPVANEYVFAEQQTAESMLEWLACEHKEPIRVKKNYLVAYMMYLLAKDGWICTNWQKVAEEMRVFANKTTLTQKNISKCLTQATRRYGGHFVGDVILNEKISDAVKRLKR